MERDMAAGSGGKRAPNWRELFVEPVRSSWIVDLSPAQQTEVAPRRIELNSDYYVSVILEAYHFPFKRRLTTTYTPVVAFETRWKMPTSEDETGLSITGPGAAPLAGAGRGGNFAAGRKVMFGPVCLNGAFSLRAGLYVSKWNEKTREAIDLVKLGSDLATGADVMMLKPVSDLAFAMVKKLFPDKPSPCYAGVDLELPEGAGTELSTGTWAVLPEQVERRQIVFNPEERRLETLGGKALKCPYFVYSIVAHERHPERLKLPEIHEARMRLSHAVKENPSIGAEALAELHKRYLLSIKLSDRLNRKDRAELSAEADEMYADILSIVGAADKAGAVQAVTQRLAEDRAPKAAFSEERGALAPEEIADAACKEAVSAVEAGADAGLSAAGMEDAEDRLRLALADIAQLVIEDEESWADKAIDMAEMLRKQRQFAALNDFVIRIRDGGAHVPWLYYYGAFSAVEMGDLEQAEAQLNWLLPRAWAMSKEQPINRSRALLVSEALGLRGRIWKSRAAALEAPDPTLYHAYYQALSVYGEAEQLTSEHSVFNQSDIDYHRVNILALIHSAESKKLKEFSRRRRPWKAARGWAEDILTRLQTMNEDPRDYELANGGDAAMFLGDNVLAAEYYARYVAAARDEPFRMNNCRRQLVELWGVDPAGRGRLPALVQQMGLLAAGGAQSVSFNVKEAEAILAAAQADAEELQASFDGVSGTLIEEIADVIELSRSVGLVKRADGSEVGTGFLMAGGDIHPDLEGEHVFITNDHVVSDHRSYAGTVSSAEALIYFERSGQKYPCRVKEVFWRSPVLKHDCAILRLDEPPPVSRAIEVCPVLPRRWLTEGGYDPQAAERSAPRVYIIGHPLGGAMRITLEKHFFIDHDGPERAAEATPEPVNVHYRAPTERGNSGSPVFDAQTRMLIAVHHKASRTPLNGRRPKRSAPYQANQGKWICAIIAAVRAERPVNGTAAHHAEAEEDNPEADGVTPGAGTPLAGV